MKRTNVIIAILSAVVAGGALVLVVTKSEIDESLNQELKSQVDHGVIEGYREAHCEGFLEQTCYIYDIKARNDDGNLISVREIVLHNMKSLASVKKDGLLNSGDIDVTFEAHGFGRNGVEVMEETRQGLAERLRGFPKEQETLRGVLVGETSLMMRLRTGKASGPTLDVAVDTVLKVGEKIGGSAAVALNVPRLEQAALPGDAYNREVLWRTVVRNLTFRIDASKATVEELVYALYLQQIAAAQAEGSSRAEAITGMNARMGVESDKVQEKTFVAETLTRQILTGMEQAEATGPAGEAIEASLGQLLKGSQQHFGISIVNGNSYDLRGILQSAIMGSRLDGLEFKPL